MSMVHDSVNVSNPTVPPSACDQATSSTSPAGCGEQASSTSTSSSVCDQTASSTTSAGYGDQTTSTSTSPSVSDQVTSNSTPPTLFILADNCYFTSSVSSDVAASCSFMSLNVSDQATGRFTLSSASNQATISSKLFSVSDQTTSSTTPPSVSDQTTNHFVQTSAISSYESYEMREYLQIVCMDDHPGYLHAVDDDANVTHSIEDMVGIIGFKNKPDNAGSPRQQHGCFSHTVDDNAYGEIDESSDPQVDDQDVYDELNEAQTTGTNDAFHLTAVDEDEPLSKQTCVAHIVLMLVGVALLVTALTVGIFYSYARQMSDSSATNVSSISHMSTAADAFGINTKPSVLPAIQYQDVLKFNDVIRGVSSSNFDASFSIFNVPPSHPNNSLYWMHVGIETPPDARTSFQMENTPLFLKKDFEATYIPTFLSKSAVVQLKPNTSVSIRSEANGSVTVTAAYWSGFQLNNLMYPVVAVYTETCCVVAHNRKIKQTQSTRLKRNKIIYKDVIINEGQDWNTADSCFTAHHSGIYVFSVSAYINFKLPLDGTTYRLASDLPDTYNRLDTSLGLCINRANSDKINRQPVIQVSMSNQPSTPMQATVSVSCLVNLSETDTVAVCLYKDYNWLPELMEIGTSASAFYYSPVSNVQVVWSVASESTGREVFKVRAGSSLQYSIVTFNIGHVWSHTHNAATITVPGIYYTVVTMGIRCVQPTTYWLRVNKQNVFKVILSTTVFRTQDNGAVIRLNVRDTLTVNMQSRTSAKCHYIGSNSYASFFGILLSPDNNI